MHAAVLPPLPASAGRVRASRSILRGATTAAGSRKLIALMTSGYPSEPRPVPSLDILLKLMATVAVVFGPSFRGGKRPGRAWTVDRAGLVPGVVLALEIQGHFRKSGV